MTTTLDWQPHAARLSVEMTHGESRWRPAIAAAPRHLFVPAWWRYVNGAGWTLHRGEDDPRRWMSAAYAADLTLVTRIGTLHADEGMSEQHPDGRPTSLSTQPSLVVRMLRHAQLEEGLEVIEVGTGSGYSTALAAARLGDEHVTTLDIDGHLVTKAAQRLETIGLHPLVMIGDATGPLPHEVDRIVSGVAMPGIPASWLAALRPGGRLVTTIANTDMIVVADTQPDGGALGRVAHDWAMVMGARHGDERTPDPKMPDLGDVAGVPSVLPVPNVREARQLRTMLELTAPGICHDYHEQHGRRTAQMWHADGSWARATGPSDGHGGVVYQAGPRRLWDILDELRWRWLAEGQFPVRGARVTIAPDGAMVLRHGKWTATLPGV